MPSRPSQHKACPGAYFHTTVLHCVVQHAVFFHFASPTKTTPHKLRSKSAKRTRCEPPMAFFRIDPHSRVPLGTQQEIVDSYAQLTCMANYCLGLDLEAKDYRRRADAARTERSQLERLRANPSRTLRTKTLEVTEGLCTQRYNRATERHERASVTLRVELERFHERLRNILQTLPDGTLFDISKLFCMRVLFSC